MPVASAAVLVFVIFAGWRMLGEKSSLTGKGVFAERDMTQEPVRAPAASREERGSAAEMNTCA